MGHSIKKSKYFRALPAFVTIVVAAQTLMPSSIRMGYAQGVPDLPRPGVMVNRSHVYELPILIGMKVNPQDPFHLNFIMDSGHSSLGGEPLKEESGKLIRYFLSALPFFYTLEAFFELKNFLSTGILWWR